MGANWKRSKLVRKPVEPVEVASHYVCAGSGQCQCGGFADTARCAGHDSRLAFQRVLHVR